MNSNHINPWNAESHPAIFPMNDNLRQLLGLYTPPER